MSPRMYKRAAAALRRVATTHCRQAHRVLNERVAMQHLAAHLRRLRIAPEMLLSSDGRAAISAVALLAFLPTTVIDETTGATLDAEWRYVIQAVATDARRILR